MLRRSFLGTTAALLAVGCVPPEEIGRPVVSGGGTSFVLGAFPRAVGPEGASLEIDVAHHLVIRRDADGSVVASMGGQGTALGELDGPECAGFAPNGDAWVLDRGNRRLQRFDAAGTPVDVLDAPHATALAVGADGALALAEAVPQQVRILAEDGTVVRTLVLGEVPRDVAWDDRGRLVVLTLSGALLRFERSGASETLVPSGSMVFPLSVAVAADGRIFVAEAGAFALRVFGADGSAVDTLHPRLDDGRMAQPIRVSAHGAMALLAVVAGPMAA